MLMRLGQVGVLSSFHCPARVRDVRPLLGARRNRNPSARDHGVRGLRKASTFQAPGRTRRWRRPDLAHACRCASQPDPRLRRAGNQRSADAMARVIVNDASCLIDLRKGGLLPVLCNLPYRFVVPLPVRESEVLDFSNEQWRQLDDAGVITHDLAPDEVAQALALKQRHPALSAYDSLCIVTALAHRGILLTGDALLRRGRYRQRPARARCALDRRRVGRSRRLRQIAAHPGTKDLARRRHGLSASTRGLQSVGVSRYTAATVASHGARAGTAKLLLRALTAAVHRESQAPVGGRWRSPAN